MHFIFKYYIFTSKSYYNVSMDIGIKIKSRRKELKITQPHLAELSGLSVNTIYKIEKDQLNPTIDVVEKIAQVLGLELLLQVKK